MLKMKVEIPELKRCCFCCPLRRGIMIFACFNLTITFLMLFAHAMCFFYYDQPFNYANYKGFFINHDTGICVMLLGCDTIAGFFLLYALFKKHVELLKIYFCYDVIAFVSALGLYVSTSYEKLIDVYMLPIVFAGTVIQCYLLLLVWNEIKKLKAKQLEEIDLEIIHKGDVDAVEKELQNGQTPERVLKMTESTMQPNEQKGSDDRVARLTQIKQ